MVAASDLLPPAERRRTGVPVKLALAVASEACRTAGRDATGVATVFSSSGGDGDNVHAILEALASTEREVSPTRFHNAVHNAAAGYWSIATQSREPSTSLCGHDASFAVGLLDAATQVVVEQRIVAVIAYDHPYPEPFNSKRPITASFGVALLMTPDRTDRAVAELELNVCRDKGDATRMQNADLEALRTGVPAARCLPLLAALARRAPATVVIENAGVTHLRVALTPC